VPVARKYAAAFGIPDLPLIPVHGEVGHDSADQLRETAKVVAARVEEIVDEYRAREVRVVDAPPVTVDTVDVEPEGDLGTAVSELFLANAWTDGLPVVPPTEERVVAMLGSDAEDAEHVLGVLAPRGGVATARKVAVCCVMAGCQPAEFPIVRAAIQAIARPEFHLSSVQSTAHPLSPLILVNGPIGERVGLSDGHDLTPAGWRPNVTIARAVRLVCINMVGLPGLVASHTQGYLCRHNDCLRENEDESPWEPYHVELGYPKEVSTVSVFPCEPGHLVDDRGSTTPQSLLTTFARVIATAGNRSVWGSAHQLCLFAPEHARYLGAQGWSKEDVRAFLYEVARIPLGTLPKDNLDSLSPWRKKLFAQAGPFDTMPAVQDKSHYRIIVFGGVGPHSMYIPTDMNARAVTEPIRDRAER